MASEHAQIKSELATCEATLASRGNAAEVAQELHRMARLAAASPEKLATNLAVWGGLLEVVTKHRAALRSHLDAPSVLRSIDASTRSALANVRADLDAGRVLAVWFDGGGGPRAPSTRRDRVLGARWTWRRRSDPRAS